MRLGLVVIIFFIYCHHLDELNLADLLIYLSFHRVLHMCCSEFSSKNTFVYEHILFISHFASDKLLNFDHDFNLCALSLCIIPFARFATDVLR